MIKNISPAGSAKLDAIFLSQVHATEIFPSNTNLLCTLTAAATAHTFSSWIEIADSAATKLSASFASKAGHIAACIIESVSEINAIYMLEIAYGAAKINITKWRFAGTTKFQNPAHSIRVRSDHIPAGETVYYRLKSATGVADTALVHFRFYLH